MNGEQKFERKWAICKNRKYDDNVHNETIKTNKETFRIDYFLYIVGWGISSLEC